MKASACVLFISICTIVTSEVLQQQQNEDVDPIKQTQNEAEASDQSKRTIFDSDNTYRIEKHVRLHPSGYKYLLGYRPVRLQFVPVAKPLYVNPVQWKAPKLHYSVKPVVTLLPPKTVPVYKSNNQFRNNWRYGKLPVNVPPNVPLKPWQQEGWASVTKDNKPFVPSAPLPEPVRPIVAPSQSPIIPIIPTVPLPTPSVSVFSQTIPPSVFPVSSPPPLFLQPKPLIPAAPVPTFNTVVPPQTVLPAPAVPVSAPWQVHSPHHIHYDVAGRPLVPINYLPGKLNLPVPDLGVLPLGSSVPVQANIQVHGHPQFISKVPQQLFIPEHHVLPKLPFPGGVVHSEQPPLPISVPFTPHPQPIQPIIPQPIHTPIHTDFPPIQQPVQPPLPQPLPQPLPHPHIHISVQQQHPGEAPPNHQQPIHNYQYFEQHGHSQFHQETPQQPAPLPIDQNYQHQPHNYQHQETFPQQPAQFPIDDNYQHQPHNYQHQETLPQQPVQLPIDHNYQYQPHNYQQQPHNYQQQPHNYQQFEQQSHQEVQESHDFFQPGKTDLQIPEYLPPHPHLRQTFVPSQQDPNSAK